MKINGFNWAKILKQSKMNQEFSLTSFIKMTENSSNKSSKRTLLNNTVAFNTKENNINFKYKLTF